MGVPFFVVIERQEFEQYASVLDAKKLLILDPLYQKRYDTFDRLGETKSKGPGPARNFAWDHSIANGHRWHWVMDDNIAGFRRFNQSKRLMVGDGTIFHCMESFVERYTNIAMAGPNYTSFCTTTLTNTHRLPPFIMNTRIYSCNLIRNDVDFRWRGRYNEDTDLSLRMLKASWCTVQFNAFLQNKVVTQALKGGNTDEFYAKEGTRAKSEMLVKMHPDVSRLNFRFGRIHHIVNYSGYKQSLVRRPGIDIPDTVDDFGMHIVRRSASAESAATATIEQ